MKWMLRISGALFAMLLGVSLRLFEIPNPFRLAAPVHVASGPTVEASPHDESPADAAWVVEQQASTLLTLRDWSDELTRGRDWLRSVPDYMAVFHKQERVGNHLRPLETIDLKVRHAPFSTAMSWREVGRLAYFPDQAHGSRMLVRMGGWKRKFGWIHLDPHASLAMQEARYPITDVGLLRLTEQLLERFEPFRDRITGVACSQQPDEEIGGRRCRVFAVDYASDAVNPDYRRSVIWLDAQWSVPLAVQNFDWAGDPDNPDGLCEYYVYENIRLNCRLSDADFSVEARPPGDALTLTREP